MVVSLLRPARALVRVVFPIVAIATVATSALSAQAKFSNIPGVLPGNVPSQGFECCQVNGVGDIVRMTAPGTIGSWDFGFSIWSACASYAAACGINPLGFSVPITLSAYDGTGGVLGSLLHQTTVSEFFGWRPASTPGDCGGDTGAWFDSADNTCYHGQLQVISFTGLNWSLPQDVAFQLSFNTQTGGYSPTGVGGPYNSLNIALIPGGGGATVGTDLNDWLIAMSSSSFGADPSYGNSVMTRLNGAADVVPEPATMALLATGLVGLTVRPASLDPNPCIRLAYRSVPCRLVRRRSTYEADRRTSIRLNADD